jgi:hypothetical protein
MKNTFEILCEKARKEDPPKVDVTERVIAIIAANEIQTDWFWDRPLMWVAAFSSAVAVPIVVLAIMLHNLWVGPLFEISQAISWVL